MAIPNFKECMLPVLKALEQNGEMDNKEMFNQLADDMGLTDEERTEYFEKKRERVFENRLLWARIHLKEAGLISKPSKKSTAITERGIELLKSNPPSIDTELLKKNYPEYKKFLSTFTPKKYTKEAKQTSDVDPMTPLEQIEQGYQQISGKLAEEMLATVRDSSPYFFEQIVVDLLLAMGYGGTWRDAGRVTKPTADGGIDGVINEGQTRPGRHLPSGQEMEGLGIQAGNPEIRWRTAR